MKIAAKIIFGKPVNTVGFEERERERASTETEKINSTNIRSHETRQTFYLVSEIAKRAPDPHVQCWLCTAIMGATYFGGGVGCVSVRVRVLLQTRRVVDLDGAAKVLFGSGCVQD